ncbi:MAG TPA: gfo/Idh/MocA family oxidoreductase [bacterium]|nr:gfo/Idh/MocA family oxidoreductase [bacterium]
MKTTSKQTSRRSFLKHSIGAGAAIAFPSIVPASVFGAGAPSNRIAVGAIGVGRISRGHDMPETLGHPQADILAVCDVDSKRAREGKEWVEKYYREKRDKSMRGIRVYEDFRDLLAHAELDAVIISTPDHWHAVPAIAAANAGKDIFLQKPASLTIAEGRALSDTIHRTGRILQIGSQQRSVTPWPQFRRACELVRNGRLGRIQSIEIGLPGDPSGDEEPEMPVPENLNYDFWLGSTPEVYYTEKRVHPQQDYSRPGWLRCEQFGAGMITGWGAHHFDTAHWGMGTEYTGPIEVKATAEFPESGLWDVHGDFQVEAKYANGVTLHASGAYPNGVKFIGTEGWIFVSRGDTGVTASDPVSKTENTEALHASDPRILRSEIGPDEIRLYESPEQHIDWIDCIRTRRQPVAPIEVGHRSCSACLVAHIAMKLNRTLYWDPVAERFKNDDEANRMVSRPMRLPWRI